MSVNRKTAKTMPNPVPPTIENRTRIRYFTAYLGSMPDMIWPAIMPGRYTILEADIALILRMCALAIAAGKLDALLPICWRQARGAPLCRAGSAMRPSTGHVGRD